MLKWRLILGTLVIGVLVLLVRQEMSASRPGEWMFPVVLLAGLAAAWELIDLLARAGYDPQRGVVMAGTLLVLAASAVPIYFHPSDDRPLERLAWPLGAMVLTVLVAFIGQMRRYKLPGGVTVNLALTVFAVAYVGLLWSFALQLRLLGREPNVGLVGVLAWIAVVKMGDIGAYTAGRLFGRHKMAPTISPGKTMEGAAGAVAFSVLAAWLSFHFLPLHLDCRLPDRPYGFLMFGLIVGISGLIGDLAESLIKRDLGTKDSSTWMPGFGGVLDLLDSLIFTAPIAYWCWFVL